MHSTQLHSSIAALGDALGAVAAGHFELSLRRVLSGPGVTRDPRFVRLVTGAAHPFGNLACLRDPADVVGTAAALEPLVASNSPAAAVFVGPVSADVEQILAAAGFVPCDRIPVMAVNIAEGLAATRLPPGFSLQRVRTAAEFREWGQVCAAGNEMPRVVGNAFLGGLDQGQVDDAAVQYYWIRKDGTPVCTSLMLLERGVAGIYCVATLPTDRNQGLGAHATAEPLRQALQAGYRVGVLHATTAGYPVYRRLGFADCGDVMLYMRMPPAASDLA